MTPLEQIKERIEALGGDGKEWIAMMKEAKGAGFSHMKSPEDFIAGKNRAIKEVITLLPSIIQEVEDAVAASYDNAELGYRPKLLSNTATEPSLKEESKYE